MTGALYFPYMGVPQNEWFARSLLYWDDIATIMPRAAAADAFQQSPYTRDLVDHRLVSLIEPEDYSRELGLVAPLVTRFLDGMADRVPKGHVDWLTSGRFTRIHLSKMAHELASSLVARRLAVSDDHQFGSWYLVEQRTASLVMTSLAIAFGAASDRTPLTDRQSELDTLVELQEAAPPDGPRDRRAIRSVIIEAILPGPKHSVAASDLREFKSRHGLELVSLRNRVEGVSIDIATIPDRAVQEERLRLARAELADDVHALADAMRVKWSDVVFGPVCGLLATGIAFSGAVASGQLPIALVGLPGLFSGIYSAYRSADRQRDWTRHPLAYAAFAHLELA